VKVAPGAGDMLIHPVSLLALALLLVNDHLLKSSWPGPITGKLSDFAGVVFFPIFLVSAWELLLALLGRWRAPSLRAASIVFVVSTATFGTIKAMPAAAELSGQTLGAAQWILGLPFGLLAGQPLPPVIGARVIADPTDLVALPASALGLWLAVRRVGARARRKSVQAAEELRAVS